MPVPVSPVPRPLSPDRAKDPSAARLPLPPTGASATATRRPPLAPARDSLVTTSAPPPPTLREQVAIAERLMGRKTRFKTEAELEAYLKSLEAARPQDAYDRDGFLAGLGLTGLRASGRTDRPVLDAVRQIPHYRPETHFGEKEIWIQQRFFDLAIKRPGLFMALTKGTNPIIEAKGRLEGDWKKPFKPEQEAVPTHVPVAERYKDALEKLRSTGGRFGADFHGGLPTLHGPEHPTYGTYAIARALGFDDAAARRFGRMSNGIDENITPYGKTSPSPLDQIDRHFNLDRKAQDTRLVYVANHLAAAIAYARQSAYDQAEIELGCGLHSLQDLFAHGQLSPSMHAVLGQFPDEVDWNPVGFYEATAATAAYLSAYLEAISEPAAEAPPAVARAARG